MLAKVSAIVVGVGILGTGSVALAKPVWFGIKPKYTTLENKEGLSGKWVDSRKKHFVDSENNDDWFDWAFRTRYQVDNDTNKKTKFQNLTKGRDNSANDSLAGACKAAYGAPSTGKVKSASAEITGTPDDEFFEDNIWKYCSVEGKKTVTQAN